MMNKYYLIASILWASGEAQETYKTFCINESYIFVCLDYTQNASMACNNVYKMDIGSCNIGNINCGNKITVKPQDISCDGASQCSLNVIDCGESCRQFTYRNNCSCMEGYNWFENSCKVIKDRNDCSIATNICHEQATCTNAIEKRHRCSCNIGYVGNGTVCKKFSVAETTKHANSTEEVNLAIKQLDLRAAHFTTNEIIETVSYIKRIENLLSIGNIKITRSTIGKIANITNGIGRKLKGLSVDKATSSTLKKQIKRDLVKSLPQIALRVDLNESQPSIAINTDLFLFQTTIYPKDNYSSISFSTAKSLNKSEEPVVGAFVPSTAVQTAWIGDTSNNTQNADLFATNRRSSFIFYKDNTLFDSAKNVSWVMSVDIGLGNALKNLIEPVKIRHLQIDTKYGKSAPLSNALSVLKTQIECVYWDFNEEDWSTKGCCLNVTSDIPECLCDHLTNFALIVKTENVPSDFVLDIVSAVGCIISIIGLIATIAVHLISKDLRRRRPNKILMHMCSNLCLSYITFVVGISQTENIYNCFLVTALMHYFMLVTWCWMSAYSYDMYLSLVKVFSCQQSFFLRRMGLMAYGIPLLVVVVTVGIAVGHFDSLEINLLCDQAIDPLATSHYKADNVCWLKGYSLYIGFLLPVGLLLLYNLVIFVIVLRELVFNKVQSSAVRQTSMQHISIAVTLTIFMGLTWVFGYILLISEEPLYVRIMSWIFATLNSLQGFGIFLLTTIRRAEARNVWWGKVQSSRMSSFYSVKRKSQQKYVINNKKRSSEATVVTNLSHSMRRPTNVYLSR